MIRLIFARHQLYSPGAAEDITYETALVHCPEIEQRINRGGRELHGLHDFTRLVGAEVVEAPAAVMPSTRPRVLVEVFSQIGDHDPFVCGAEGHITAEMIEEIERDLREGVEDDQCTRGAGSYLFDVTHQDGQYGDEGRCEIPPHFELALVAFEDITSQRRQS